MQRNHWKKLDSNTLFTHPRLTVAEDDVELPDGHQTKYLRYENLQDYVTVIATRDDQIAFIKEYSYPHDEWLWQFPEGSIEGNDTPEDTAIRELQEETGLAADKIDPLGMNYSHHRRSTEKNHVFLASGAHDVEKAVGDIEEQGTELHWFTLAEAKRMVAAGGIVQKNTLAALALYLVHLA